jgi:phosphoenolpyruvate synthase/pyruvate phosphate dikinase
MDESVKWLPDAVGTTWEFLGTALQSGLPVPAGYIVSPSALEIRIREAYDELKTREKTHFLAVRGNSHAVLNVIGADCLIHTLRRFWAEAPDSAVLVQRMIPAMWCGKAHWHRKNLRIKANEGMMVLDPDTYLINTATDKCIRRTLESKQRKMIRHVDGSSRVLERDGERTPMPDRDLAGVANLAAQIGRDIGWAIDDLEKVWLLSVLS